MKIDFHATGTVVSILGLMITMMMGSIWLGELSHSVTTLKEQAVSAERIARIEERLDALVDGQSRLSVAIDGLAGRIDKTEDRSR
jgi:hypothetical protein